MSLYNQPSDFFSNIMEEFEISTKKKSAASSKKAGDRGSLSRDGDKGQPTAVQPVIILFFIIIITFLR